MDKFQILVAIQALMVAIALIAALIDWRTGLIPNWLTLPPVAIAPMAFGFWLGWYGVIASVIGIFVCGLIPYILFQKGAIGGGDVKLFAALGAIGAPHLRIIPFEAQLYAFMAASVIALVKIFWTGSLKQSLTTMGHIASNPFRSKANKRVIDLDQATSLRLGPAIFIGLLISLWGLY